jgi:hypothetical protein
MWRTLYAVIPIAGEKRQRVSYPGAEDMPLTVGEDCFAHFRIPSVTRQIVVTCHGFAVYRVSTKIYGHHDEQRKVYDADSKYDEADPEFYFSVHSAG